MAVLPEADRAAIWRHFMRRNTEPCAFTKADMRAAVDACDTWVDNNISALNTALPTAFRNNASVTQKAFLLCYVTMRRVGVLRVDEDV